MLCPQKGFGNEVDYYRIWNALDIYNNGLMKNNYGQKHGKTTNRQTD